MKAFVGRSEDLLCQYWDVLAKTLIIHRPTSIKFEMQKISWQEKVKFEIQVELNRLITGAFTCNANWVKWDGEVWGAMRTWWIFRRKNYLFLLWFWIFWINTLRNRKSTIEWGEWEWVLLPRPDLTGVALSGQQRHHQPLPRVLLTSGKRQGAGHWTEPVELHVSIETFHKGNFRKYISQNYSLDLHGSWTSYI